MNKVYGSCAEAVADVWDGATVLVGGFGGSGTPFNLVDALVAHGARDLTIVGNSPPEWLPFVQAGLARKIISGFTNHPIRPQITEMVEGLIRDGKLEAETVPHGILEERIRAAGAGIPAFYSPVGVGTPLEAGKEKRALEGKEFLLERALRADFALVKGHKGDRSGNITCRLAAGNRNITMAQGGTATIAEVEEIVEAGELDPNRVDIPGIFVQRVVRAPKVSRWLSEGAGSVDASQRQGAKPVLSRELIALRVARELRDGMYVNLGFGIPTLVSNFLPPEAGVTFHSEQGILGVGPAIEDPEQWDIDLVNAAGRPVGHTAGASFTDLATSFGMIRGGHLDATVLGAYQVSETGDLASWQTRGSQVGGLGGAMELAVGAKLVIVAMHHTTMQDSPKIVERCTYPLTAQECVDLIVTDVAVIRVSPKGLVLQEVAPEWTAEEVQAITKPRLLIAEDLKEVQL